jgi:hypothetical protein
MKEKTVFYIFTTTGVKFPIQIKWVHGEFRFEPVNLSTVPTNPGVYAFVINGKIYKIGDANGKLGLQGRLKQYFQRGKNRATEPTAQRFGRVMESSEFNKALIDIYYIEASEYGVLFSEIKETYVAVRNYESDLIEKAHNEGEPMSLSRNNKK